jgi:hypothetical protein
VRPVGPADELEGFASPQLTRARDSDSIRPFATAVPRAAHDHAELIFRSRRAHTLHRSLHLQLAFHLFYFALYRRSLAHDESRGVQPSLQCQAAGTRSSLRARVVPEADGGTGLCLISPRVEDQARWRHCLFPPNSTGEHRIRNCGPSMNLPARAKGDAWHSQACPAFPATRLREPIKPRSLIHRPPNQGASARPEGD